MGMNAKRVPFEAPKERSREYFGGFRQSCEVAPRGAQGASLEAGFAQGVCNKVDLTGILEGECLFILLQRKARMDLNYLGSSYVRLFLFHFQPVLLPS